jgi:16S rRNA (cytosine1402-N4)-methyltransferase
VQKSDSYPHTSVLLKETLSLLDLKPGKIVVDCTLGLGGHSVEMLHSIGPTGYLYAFDRDERNIAVAQERLAKVGENVEIFHDSFASLKDRLKRKGVSQVDALLFDLGLSSPHLDRADRGFSFLKEGPLDMRFDASNGKTAADLLNGLKEEELADIFYYYGEERRSRRLAKAILERRKVKRFETTLDLMTVVEDTLGSGRKHGKGSKKHPAAQIFQALRIAVNEELEALELVLHQAVELLAPHGRAVVISYHSLEDRLVKQFFKRYSTDLRDPNDPYGRRVQRPKSLSLLTKKPIRPSAQEVAENSRSRSALLRAVEKL